MQSLRLVGRDSDGRSVILESLDGHQRFSLPLDERLRDVSSPEPPPSPRHAVENGQPLSPREIQTRVRAGESAQAVADSAGVELDRVMRFAFPVLAERTRVVDEALRARARRAGENTLVEFGGLINERLTRHGVNPAGVGWDAYRRDDGGWTVVAAFSVHEQNHLAKFNFALHNRAVTALDALAADLLSDRPVQALLPPQPDPVSELEPPAAPTRLAAVPDRAGGGARTGDDDAGGAGTGEGNADEAGDADHIDGAGPAAKPAIRPGRRQKAHTHPIPVDEDELFDQEAYEAGFTPGEQSSTGFPPVDQGTPVTTPAAGATANWHEPSLPLDWADGRPDQPTDAQPGEPADPSDREPGREQDTEQPGDEPRRRARRGDKPRMPSWDDILLGVRHKSD